MPLCYAQSLFLPISSINLSNRLRPFLSLATAERCLDAAVLGYLLSFKMKSGPVFSYAPVREGRFGRFSRPLSRHSPGRNDPTSCPAQAFPAHSWQQQSPENCSQQGIASAQGDGMAPCGCHTFPLYLQRRGGNNFMSGPTFWTSEKGRVRQGLGTLAVREGLPIKRRLSQSL